MSRPLKILLGVVLAFGLIALARALPIGALESRLAGLGGWGPVVFALIYIVAVVLLVPASPLTLVGGAMFGVVVGTITISIASTVGAALAFLVARYLARDAVVARARRFPQFDALDRAIGREGWKIVALLRLSPAVPFNVQNYLYGLTGIRFWTYVLTSWVAMLPGTVLYVYLGHVGRAGLEAASGGGKSGRTPAEWALIGVGLLATLAVTVELARIARKALRERAGLSPLP